MKHVTFAPAQDTSSIKKPQKLAKTLSSLALVSTLAFGCGPANSGFSPEIDRTPSSNTIAKRAHSAASQFFKEASLELSVYHLLDEMVQKEKMRKFGRFDLYSQAGYLRVSEEQFDLINKLVREGKTPLIRAAASRALAYTGDLRAVGTLTGALNDEDDSVRHSAAHALGRIGPHNAKELQTAVPALIEHMKSARPGMCWYAYPLRIIDSSFDPLVSVLRDKNSGEIARIYAAEILGDKGTIAVMPLIEALYDPSNTVRRFAIEGLTRSGDERAVPALKKLIVRLERISRDEKAPENEQACADADIKNIKEFFKGMQ